MKEGRKNSYRRMIIRYNPVLKDRARKLRQNMTLGEKALWEEIKRKKLGFDFDRQRPIHEYIVDFYCKDLMLAIEVDGASHDSEEARLKDKNRQFQLELLGIRFLRFEDMYVRNQVEKVVEEISSWIEEHKDDLVGRVAPESGTSGQETHPPTPSEEGEVQ